MGYKIKEPRSWCCVGATSQPACSYFWLGKNLAHAGDMTLRCPLDRETLQPLSCSPSKCLPFLLTQDKSTSQAP